MVATFVWPWKNDDELLEVRRLFYPGSQLDDSARRENQQLAVNIVNTWKLRHSRIPHSILATADLVDALLHHANPSNSPSTCKAVYASALSKFVTSICDLEQDGLEKRSMMEQATKLGMPEEWVLLRHAITHGATPGLKVMENAVREAVPWMWGHFWRGLEEEDEVTEDKLREQFVRLLGEYQRQRRAFITSKQEAAVDMSLAAQTSKVIRRMCKKRRDGLDHLVYVLVKENIILPSEKQTNLKFRALLLVWNDLLLSISTRQPKFLAKLSSALTDILTSSPAATTPPVATDMSSKWLRHILINTAWASTAAPAGMESICCDVVETCLMRKNEYTQLVLEEVLDAMSGEQAETLKKLVEYCEGEGMEVDEAEDETETAAVEEVEEPVRRTGWSRPVAVWVPRAIGA